MVLVGFLKGGQNRKSSPGCPEGKISIISYALGMDLIGFVRGAQNRKSGPGGPEGQISIKS